MAVDSRRRIGEYHQVMLKPNESEALRAVFAQVEPVERERIEEAGESLRRRTERPVFVTMGDQGILLCTEQGVEMVPAVPVTGEIDIVGAGDSTLASIVASLASGATLSEAALVGNLVASVTIRCIGTTGTASQEQVLEALDEWRTAHQAE
jgi:bifunctional ADP-heptose synthase (sugar kinase/adenylyltransferase)